MLSFCQFIVFFSLLSMTYSCTTIGQSKPIDLSHCKSDKECIVVDHDHCCGSTKLSINIKYLKMYRLSKSLQKTSDPKICATIGICRKDHHIQNANCLKSTGSDIGVCTLKID